MPRVNDRESSTNMHWLASFDGESKLGEPWPVIGGCRTSMSSLTASEKKECSGFRSTCMACPMPEPVRPWFRWQFSGLAMFRPLSLYTKCPGLRHGFPT